MSDAGPARTSSETQAHQLCQYRGVRRSLADTLTIIRDDLVTPPYTEEAWRALLLFTPPGDDALLGQLAKAVAARRSAWPDDPMAALATFVAMDRPNLLCTLAGRPEVALRLVAFIGLARAKTPIDKDARQALRSLATDPDLPEGGKISAVAELWPRLASLGAKAEAFARDLLDRLTTGPAKGQALNRVRSLEKRLGPVPLITERRRELEERVVMSCPRCEAKLLRPVMEEHLWKKHRLLLDGLSVREPWSVVEEWLDRARDKGEMDWVARCRIAATRIDPGAGLARLEGLLLARGLVDEELRRSLLVRAKGRNAACCPHCWTFVPAPLLDETPPHLRRGSRLTCGSFRLEVSESGWRSRLEVHAAKEVIYDGPEPGGRWSTSVAAFLAALPFVLAAFAYPVVGPMPVVGVLVLAAMALGVDAFVRARHRRRPARERVVEQAWIHLAPLLHEGGFRASDADLFAGLARISRRTGNLHHGGEQLPKLVRITEQALTRGQALPRHFAEPYRMLLQRNASDNEDPVAFLANRVSRCFDGTWPLALAQGLLDDWESDWTKVEAARLRVLLCDRAFEAGFEVHSLIDAGRIAPALGSLLGTHAPRSLAALRVLWKLRASRPWDRLEPVRTAFEFAADPENASMLGERTGILLVHLDEDLLVGGEGERPWPLRICMTLTGIWLQNTLFAIPPGVTEVRTRGGYSELILGSSSFRSVRSLDPLEGRMRKWLGYFFREFLPEVDKALRWRSPHRTAMQRAMGALPCPQCGRLVLPRVGEVAAALEDAG